MTISTDPKTWLKPTECVPDDDLWTKEDCRPDLWKRAELRWQQESARRGWKPSSSSCKCPRELVGRCSRRSRGDEHCWCHEIRTDLKCHPMDHVRRWVEVGTRRVVLTAEPYWADGTDEQLADWTRKLQEWCAGHSLQLEISDRSPYYPGRTVLLVFRRAVAPAAT